MATHHRQTQRRSSWKLWVVPVLLILLIAGLGRSQKETIIEKLGLQHIDIDEQMYTVGQDVTLSGTLSSSNNLRQYTMMLTTSEDGIFGVKSNVLDLSNYRGKDVIVRGTISTIINNIPVINAVSLVGSNEDTTESHTITDVQYIPSAGIVLDPSALNELALDNIGTEDITFSTDDGSSFSLSFFECTKDQSSTTGCEYITEQLATSPLRFTGTDGSIWIQLPETNSWFGSSDNRIGYRINNTDKSVVTTLVNSITFVNNRYVTRHLIPEAKDACQTIDHTLNYVSDSSFEYLGDAVIITLVGTDTENNDITCKVSADPRTKKVTLQRIQGDNDTKNTSETENEPQNNTANDDADDATIKNNDQTRDDTASSAESGVNTDPAPSFGTPLPFTSSKGYTIVFPSSNIAFQGVNNTESLGIDGVAGCWSQMNVVAFSNAANAIDNPAIIMYDCRDVGSKIGSHDDYIRKDGTASDKTFFIKVVNPEWKDFAQAITIQ